MDGYSRYKREAVQATTTLVRAFLAARVRPEEKNAATQKIGAGLRAL